MRFGCSNASDDDLTKRLDRCVGDIASLAISNPLRLFFLVVLIFHSDFFAGLLMRLLSCI